MSTIQKVNSVQIREVWNDNLEDEFDLIREIVDDYPYVAMGAYSLGSVIRPVGNCHYQIFKANVYKVKLFQLVLTFSDKAGTLPTCGTDKYCVWQFNFRQLGEDLSQNELIELLRQSRIDFKKNNEKGINEQNFAELLMSSGVVLNKDVNFVSFDGGSNFGYLVKLLKGKNLPETQPEFYSWAKTYLPTFYDIKHLMKFCDGLHEGLDLDKLAELLGEERIGNCCQAGSDSLLTSATFKKMKECFFNGSTEKYGGVLYGLGI